MSSATIPMRVLSRQLGDAIAGRRVRAAVWATDALSTFDFPGLSGFPNDIQGPFGVFRG